MQTYLNLDVQQFRKLLHQCNGKTITLDTETTGLRWWSSHVVTVGFVCTDAEIEGCIDFGKPVEEGHEEDEDLLLFEKQVREVINTELKAGTNVVMHNAKFDMGMMGVPHEDCNGWNIFDTAVMVHLWDSRLKKKLEFAERELLGTNSKRSHIEQAPSNKKIRNKIWRWPSNVRQDYCLNDVRVTLQLAQVLKPMLAKMELTKLFLKDMQYLKLVYHTEHLGITLDQEKCGKAQLSLMAHAKDLETQLMDAVGYVFNWRSNKQLSKAIYEDMGIAKPINPFAKVGSGEKNTYKTKLGFERTKELRGGMYNETMTSTFLLMEKVHHPLGELISSLREASKLARTIGQWLDLVDKDSVLHSNFNLTGTRTGRLSSSKPNLANVASDVRSRFTQGLFSGGLERTDEYNLRNAFVARPGHAMLSIDFRQQEMRLFAWESQDERMLEAVKSGLDIHLMIAKAVWGDCGKEQNKIHREWSKTVGFGLLYGMTTGSLEHKLGLTREAAQKVIADYWDRFPNIRPYLFGLVDHCKEYGHVRNWAGRIWREETEQFMYKSCNFMVQGGSADLLSVAAMRTHKWLKQNKAGEIISYIYDELLMEVKFELLEETANVVGKIMEVEDILDIPFLTDCKAGTSYGNMIGMPSGEDGRWHLTKEHEELFREHKSTIEA